MEIRALLIDKEKPDKWKQERRWRERKDGRRRGRGRVGGKKTDKGKARKRGANLLGVFKEKKAFCK